MRDSFRAYAPHLDPSRVVIHVGYDSTMLGQKLALEYQGRERAYASYVFSDTELMSQSHESMVANVRYTIGMMTRELVKKVPCTPIDIKRHNNIPSPERSAVPKSPVLKGSLKTAVKNVMQTDLRVIPRLHNWYVEHADEPLPESIADLIHEQLTTPGRDRSASFSPSGLGTCLRRQVFRYHGVTELRNTDSDLANLFSDGTWRHLRLQSTLLHAGIIHSIEVPMKVPELRLRGNADGEGVMEDGRTWMLELKGCNERVFTWLMKRDDPKEEHLLQGAGYAIGLGYDVVSFVYECKNTQRLKEFVVDYTDERYARYLEQARFIIDELNRAIDNEELPPVLEGDATKECKTCPFQTECAGMVWENLPVVPDMRDEEPRKVRLRKPEKSLDKPARKKAIPEEKLPWKLRNPSA